MFREVPDTVILNDDDDDDDVNDDTDVDNYDDDGDKDDENDDDSDDDDKDVDNDDDEDLARSLPVPSGITATFAWWTSGILSEGFFLNFFLSEGGDFF